MNICIISGQLVGNATVRGKGNNLLVFTVVPQQQPGEADPMTSIVPCVMFNPDNEVKRLLTTQATGRNIEFQGRVNASRFEMSDGPRSNGEVIVYNRSVKIGEVSDLPSLRSRSNSGASSAD